MMPPLRVSPGTQDMMIRPIPTVVKGKTKKGMRKENLPTEDI